jgi:hypothetical protein
LQTLARERYLLAAGECHERTSSQSPGRVVNFSLPGGHHGVMSSDLALKLFCFSERGLLFPRSFSFLRRLYRKKPEKGE